MSIDMQIEKQFVRHFVVSRMRERMLFELNHPEKRGHAIGRFCHHADELLIPRTIHIKDSKLSILEISRVVSSFITDKNRCYVMSYYELDTCTMSFDNALEYCFDAGMASILVLDSKNVFVKAEQSYGPADKYILHID